MGMLPVVGVTWVVVPHHPTSRVVGVSLSSGRVVVMTLPFLGVCPSGRRVRTTIPSGEGGLSVRWEAAVRMLLLLLLLKLLLVGVAFDAGSPGHHRRTPVGHGDVVLLVVVVVFLV